MICLTQRSFDGSHSDLIGMTGITRYDDNFDRSKICFYVEGVKRGGTSNQNLRMHSHDICVFVFFVSERVCSSKQGICLSQTGQVPHLFHAKFSNVKP